MASSSKGLAVFGFGNVGGVLARQILDIGQKVVAVADSSGVLVAEQGLSRRDVQVLQRAKTAGGRVLDVDVQGALKVQNPAEAVEILASKNVLHCVTDCSAFPDPGAYLFPALKRSVPIALANKKPLTGPYEDFLRLTENENLIGLESTCGAGLPVIVTLKRMLASGDEIFKIEGQLSGTLGYILSALESGGKFSEIVRRAKAEGFTEPDPRDDLSGTDVARKALILARCIGEQVDMSDLLIEALYPKEFGDMELAEFMDRLGELDDMIGAKVERAKVEGRVLRYAAVVEPAKPISVGLVAVEKESPLGSLNGTDNLVSFSSKFYSTSPTVVRGPGAGLEVTAAGVLSDALSLIAMNSSSR